MGKSITPAGKLSTQGHTAVTGRCLSSPFSGASCAGWVLHLARIFSLSIGTISCPNCVRRLEVYAAFASLNLQHRSGSRIVEAKVATFRRDLERDHEMVIREDDRNGGARTQ